MFSDPSIILVLLHPGFQLLAFFVGVPLFLAGQSLWQHCFPAHPRGPHLRQWDCRDEGCFPAGG